MQRTLAQLLQREMRDPRLRPLTITHVKVSPDLTHVWAHYSMLSGDSHDPLQREILNEAALICVARSGAHCACDLRRTCISSPTRNSSVATGLTT